MPLPSVFLIHSATLLHNNGYMQALTVTGATGTAVVGQTVTGATSHATAVIETVSPLVVKSATGPFTAGETLSTATWSATFSSQADACNVNQELIPDTSSSTIACRFVGPQESMRVGSRNVPYIVSTPRVLMPAGTAVSEGDTITSTETGFSGTFTVNSVKQTYEAAQKIVSHITCEIAAAGATGGA